MKANRTSLHSGRGGCGDWAVAAYATPVWRRAWRLPPAPHANARASASLALPPQLSISETNIQAIETIMEWNLRIARNLEPVAPVSLGEQLCNRLHGAGQELAGCSGNNDESRQLGVLCPWLPNTAALRELRGSGFAVAGIECGGAAVERLSDELGLGPEETGVHDGWTRRALPQHAATAAAAPGAPSAAAAAVDGNASTSAGPPPGPTARTGPTSPQLWVYRGNPYLLTPPVLSLFPYPVTGVWDVWGVLVTPPQLLRRYAGVWADLLPRGGVWLAAALVRRQPARDGATAACGAEAQQADQLEVSLRRAGLHVYSAQLLAAVAEQEGFDTEELEVPAPAAASGNTDTVEGAGTSSSGTAELIAEPIAEPAAEPIAEPAAEPAAGQRVPPVELRTALLGRLVARLQLATGAAAGCDVSGLRVVVLAMSKR